MIIVKRYPNRKLYNTDQKEYINLDGIANLIREGEEIHVIDYATGEDLTALTLTQVLFDQVKQQAGFFPRTVLAGLIQAGGSRLSAIQRVLIHSLGPRQHADEEIRRRITLLIEQGELDAEQGYRLMEKLITLGGQQEERSPNERSPNEPKPGEELVERLLEERGLATHRELQSLLENIDALSAKLEEINSLGDIDHEAGRASP